MFAQHRKEGPSAVELLQSTRGDYVKTEALKDAKLEPGSPRLFDSSENEKTPTSEWHRPSVQTKGPLRRRMTEQVRTQKDFTSFGITPTASMRPPNYKPLESSGGAFRAFAARPRAASPDALSSPRLEATCRPADERNGECACCAAVTNRTRDTFAPLPDPPPLFSLPILRDNYERFWLLDAPPRPPKPEWMRKPRPPVRKETSECPQRPNKKPIPTPRLSKLNSTRRQTVANPYAIGESAKVSVAVRLAEKNPKSVLPQESSSHRSLEGINLCDVVDYRNAVTQCAPVVKTKSAVEMGSSEDATRVPHPPIVTSKLLLSSASPQPSFADNTVSFLRVCNCSLFMQLSSPLDSDSGLYHSSFESLDSNSPKLESAESVGGNPPASTAGWQPACGAADASKAFVEIDFPPEIPLSEDELFEKQNTSSAPTRSSDLSIFTSITENNAVYSGSSTDGRSWDADESTSLRDDAARPPAADVAGAEGAEGTRVSRAPLLGRCERARTIGRDPSLIEKNARVIKWIYGCPLPAT